VTVYDFPFAPDARKLRVYLAEKGIELPLKTVSLVRGEHRSADFLEKNPMGAMPLLELDVPPNPSRWYEGFGRRPSASA